MNIDTLVAEARETMLEKGDIMPMIYLKLSEDIIHLVLDVLSDTQSIPAQCGILARLGWEECKKHPGQQPIAIGIYTEAWRIRGGATPQNMVDQMRPSSSRYRQEIIAVSFWQANQKPHYLSCSLPVIRNRRGKILEVIREEIQETSSYQMEAFLQGVRDAQRPDDEVFKEMDAQLEAGIAGLTEDQRRTLQKLVQHEYLVAKRRREQDGALHDESPT